MKSNRIGAILAEIKEVKNRCKDCHGALEAIDVTDVISVPVKYHYCKHCDQYIFYKEDLNEN